MAIKYKWLAEELKKELPTLRKLGIDKLPSEAELCQSYHVSRQTVRQALVLLEQKGLIEKHQGSGSFITGRTESSSDNEIALLITSDQDYLYPILIDDIKNGLAKAGFSCSVYVTDNRRDREREILEGLCESLGKVSGTNPSSHKEAAFSFTYKKPLAIISEGCKSALPNPNLDLYRRLMQMKLPMLFLHNYYPALNHSVAVKDNNYQGAVALVNHLKERGHRKIAGFFPSDDMQGLERYLGYAETLRLFHLEINDDYVGWFHRQNLLDLERAQNTLFIKRFVDNTLLKQDCTAIVCYNDEVAFYLIRELKKHDIQVPKDFAVASFDNSYLARADHIGITSMAHNPHAMGQKAAEMVVDMLKGKDVKTYEVPWQIQFRESTLKQQ